MAIVVAINGTLGRGFEGLRDVHVHKIPTGAKGTSGAIGDKKETVIRKGDGCVEGSFGGRG